MEKLNLYQKIQQVSNEIKNIEKNMTVGKGSYSYKAVQDIDVTLGVKEAETKFKILSIPIKQELLHSEIVKVQKNDGESILYNDVVKMTLRIVDLESPQDYIDVESFGRGLDSGDKGFGKASTYARKYALLNAYKIATGEDPDAEKMKEEKTVKTIDEKRMVVTNYVMANTSLLNNIMEHFNKGSMDELGSKEIDHLYSWMSKKGVV